MARAITSDAIDKLMPVSIQRASSAPQANGRFRNPGENLDYTVRTTLSSLWDYVFKKRDTKPPVPLPVTKIRAHEFELRNTNQLRVAWIGHSSLLINIDGFLMMTDPVLEESVSFFGPTRYNGEAPIAAEELPKVDAVLISHNHYDHLNRYTIGRIHKKVSRFIVPLGVGSCLSSWGVAKEKIVELDWWETVQLNGALMLVCTPAQHFSGRGLTDSNKSLWSSFVVKSRHHSFFFGGDSGYFAGFKQIGKAFGPFDVTFLECGAYDKHWSAIHMMPEQTVRAHIDLKGNVLHPIHWGTFDLAMHPWYEPMQRLSMAAARAQIITATPVVGGITEYGSKIPTDRWWESVLENISHANQLDKRRKR